MNKKMIALAALLIGAMLLGGCRFAMEDTADAGKDIMVGMSLRVYDPGEPDGVDGEGNVYWYPDDDEASEYVWDNMDGDDTYIGHSGEEELTEEITEEAAEEPAEESPVAAEQDFEG